LMLKETVGLHALKDREFSEGFGKFAVGGGGEGGFELFE